MEGDEGAAPGLDAATPLRFYGRRHGRRLRAGRRTLIAAVLPELAVAPAAFGTHLDPVALFPRPVREVWLEIGFGAGEHLLAQARAHPGIGMIGAEPFINGIAALIAAWQRDPTDNLRLFLDDARLLLPSLLDASIARVFLLFPDPWPKARHQRRRFIGPATTAALARILVDGGELRIATDAALCVRWVLAHLAAAPAFVWSARRPADWRQPPADWVATRYQRKSEAAGRPLTFLSFFRRPRDAG